MHKKFWSENQTERDHLGDPEESERILEKQNIGMWTGFICFRTETSGGLLWKRQWTNELSGASQGWELLDQLSDCFSSVTLFRGVSLYEAITGRETKESHAVRISDFQAETQTWNVSNTRQYDNVAFGCATVLTQPKRRSYCSKLRWKEVDRNLTASCCFQFPELGIPCQRHVTLIRVAL
jgi:hypothetical protein